jgi:hypothetical protein
MPDAIGALIGQMYEFVMAHLGTEAAGATELWHRKLLIAAGGYKAISDAPAAPERRKL